MDKRISSFIKDLKQRKLTLALAESMTCGLATHKLSTCPGTADVLKGSVICYTPEVKMNLLGVSKSMIEKYTCESLQVTECLSRKLSRLIKADIYASITGLASAGGSETKDKPVGTVFFCLYYKGVMYNSRKVFRGTPLEIREKSCHYLYRFIKSTVKNTH